ncbi:hypothetical protein Tco_0392477 [Tanacetum coccineum]
MTSVASWHRVEIGLDGLPMIGTRGTDRVLETQAYRHEWQRQDTDDHAIEHIIRTQALEAGARVDTLEDTGSSAYVRISEKDKRNDKTKHGIGKSARKGGNDFQTMLQLLLGQAVTHFMGLGPAVIILAH